MYLEMFHKELDRVNAETYVPYLLPKLTPCLLG